MISQHLPKDYEEKLLSFQGYVIRLKCKNSSGYLLDSGYLLGQIGNADQTPVYFEMTSVKQHACNGQLPGAPGQRHERKTATIEL